MQTGAIRTQRRPGGIVAARIQVSEVLTDLYRTIHRLGEYDEIDRISEELDEAGELLIVYFPRLRGDDSLGLLRAQELEVARIKAELAKRFVDDPLGDIEYLVWLHDSIAVFVDELRSPSAGSSFEGLLVNCFLVDIWRMFYREARRIIQIAEPRWL